MTHPLVKIGFIGAGHMGEALLAALLRKKVYRPAEIGVSTAHAKTLSRLRKKYRIHPFHSNIQLIQAAKTILLAVKPQQMGTLLSEIKPYLHQNHLLLSIAAGLDTRYYHQRLPRGTRLIRAMPNTPSQLGVGAIGIYLPPRLPKGDRTVAFRIFSATGELLFVPQERWLDAITALSASGIAFVYYFAQSLIKAAAVHQIPLQAGKKLILQTLLGAAQLAQKNRRPLDQLIKEVTSKGGTTEAGLKVLGDGRFEKIIFATVNAAVQRAFELRKGG